MAPSDKSPPAPPSKDPASALRSFLSAADVDAAAHLVSEVAGGGGPHQHDLLIQMGEIAEESGALDIARQALCAAARIAPDSADAHHRAGLLLWDLEELDAATHHLHRAHALAPLNAGVLLDLVEVVAEAGDHAGAAALLRDHPDITRRSRRALQLQRNLEAQKHATSPPDQPAPSARASDSSSHASWDSAERPQNAPQPSGGAAAQSPRAAVGLSTADAPLEHSAQAGRGPSAAQRLGLQDAASFWACFAGREGVYARQWVSADGRSGYTPIREPFTVSVARAHLAGEITVGIYPVRLDQTVPFVAFDLDLAKFARAQSRHRPEARRAWLGRVHEVAARLQSVCAERGVPTVLEDSGHKGRHLWILFRDPVPAAAARRLARLLASHIEPLPAYVTLEVFPRQVRVRPDQLGNLIKLPLGIHRVSGRPSVLLDPHGHPVPDPVATLTAARRLGSADLTHLLPNLRASEPVAASLAHGSDASTAPNPSQRPSHATPTASTAPAGQAPPPAVSTSVTTPARSGYRLDDDLELHWLLDRCPVLSRIVSDVGLRHHLGQQERLVLTYTLGHLSHGAEIVNALVDQAFNLDQSAQLKSRLRGNPMSCPKIRSKVPHITQSAGCSCRFDPGSGHYPTPLLHLRSLADPALGALPVTGGARALHLSRMQVERAVSEYLRVRADYARLSALLRSLERQIHALFEEQRITELPTQAGLLRIDAERPGSLVLLLPSRSSDGRSHPVSQDDALDAPHAADLPRAPDAPNPRPTDAPSITNATAASAQSQTAQPHLPPSAQRRGSSPPPGLRQPKRGENP